MSDFCLDDLDDQKVEPLSGGRNAQVFRAWRDGQSVVLKFFLGKNAALRFKREEGSYQFLASLPQQWSPKLLETKSSPLCLVLEDIQSAEKIKRLSAAQLAQLFDFFSAVLVHPVSESMPLAENAAADRAALLQDMASRIAQLKQVNDARLEDWKAWFEYHFAQLWQNQKVLPEKLALGQQRWVPADFSLQNLLYLSDIKRFYIIDFEYAGRDDPARWVADWVWHPGQQLTAHQVEQIEGFFIEKLKGADKLFEQRYAFLKQACGLRWLLIMLNCFLPGYRQQRPWLANTAADWQEMGAKQLAQAEVFRERWERYASRISRS